MKKHCPVCGKLHMEAKQVTTSGFNDPVVAPHLCPHGYKCRGGHATFTAEHCDKCEEKLR